MFTQDINSMVPMNQTDFAEMYDKLSPVIDQVIKPGDSADALLPKLEIVFHIMMMNLDERSEQEVDTYFTNHSNPNVQTSWNEVKNTGTAKELYTIATEKQLFLSKEKMKAFVDSCQLWLSLDKKYIDKGEVQYKCTTIYNMLGYILSSEKGKEYDVYKKYIEAKYKDMALPSSVEQNKITVLQKIRAIKAQIYESKEPSLIIAQYRLDMLRDIIDDQESMTNDVLMDLDFIKREIDAKADSELELSNLKTIIQEMRPVLEKNVSLNSPDELIKKVNIARRLQAILNNDEEYDEIKIDKENNLITYNNSAKTGSTAVEENGDKAQQIITNFSGVYHQERQTLLKPLGVKEHILSAVDTVIAKFVKTVDTILNKFTARSRLHEAAKADIAVGLFSEKNKSSVVRRQIVKVDREMLKQGPVAEPPQLA